MMMNDTHIRSLDVTLLLIVEALLRMRNMSAVAAEMGLTQSAISHAVGRLRVVFDDPLFIRKGAGVEPTARALQIGPILAEALSGIRAAANIGRSFEPATAMRRFTIAAPDTVVMTIAPAILTVLGAAAPRCQALFRILSPNASASAVVAGEADMAVGPFPTPPKNTIRAPLVSETFNVAARDDHPGIKDVLDLETYCALDHLLVGYQLDERGMVDAILDGLNRRRRIVGIMPQLSLALAAASQTDAIITAPSSACRHAASLFPLTLYEPPMALPTLEVGLLRHSSGSTDPALNWLANLITEALPSRLSNGPATLPV
jgi:DNA-binding transcriptional LysR family regulator